MKVYKKTADVAACVDFAENVLSRVASMA